MKVNSNTKPEGAKPVLVAVYTRKSTAKGLNVEDNTLQFQREACEDFIKAKRGIGWEVYPEYYDDGGFTGANTDRPALQRLLADAKVGKFDAIAVYKVDRISRSVGDLVSMVEEFQRLNIDFVSVSQSFDTSNSMGRLILNILASFGQFERETIVERIRDKRDAARRKGKFLGGPPPLGYDIHPEGKRLVVNEEEAATVCEVFQLYLERQSILEVMEELAERGVRTKRRTTITGRITGGVQLSRPYVSGILRNRLYLGQVAYNGEVFEGEHKAIIDEQTFAKAQALLSQKNPRDRRARSRKSYALLQGLIYCQHSGELMSPTYTKRNGKKYIYYQCSRYNRKGECGCKKRRISAAMIEQDVIGELRRIGSDSEFIESLITPAEAKYEAQVFALRENEANLKVERKRLHARLRYCERKPEKAEEVETIQEGLEDIRQGLDQIRNQLERIGLLPFSASDFRDALARFNPAWDALSFGERRRMVELLIDRIVFDGNEGKFGAFEIVVRNSGIVALTEQHEV
ncbi:recombinase family protein [Sulfidibacter corallicola]|nr:recombinase family protein [Sulfidibacter corallicola]